MAQENSREGLVLGAVVSLVDSLLEDFDVIELLTDLTERCVELLDIASAGLLLADPSDQLHLVAATSDRTRDLELFQLQSAEGPCLDCFAHGSAVSVADLREQQTRWPQFVPAAMDAGFRSVHALPMRAAGSVLGALGLFDADIGALDDDDHAVGQTLAHIATVAIVQGGPPETTTVKSRLQNAVSSRVAVEQAKGFLHERLDVSFEAAAAMLRNYARLHDTHMTDVARRVIGDIVGRGEILDELRR